MEKKRLGYLGLIKPEVDLISTILRTSSRLDGNWILAESGECDALLAYNAEKTMEPYHLTPETQLIMIKRRGEIYSGYAFFKPFRADELVDTLELIQSNTVVSRAEAFEPEVSQKLYRLKRWPPNVLIGQNKHFMLLAVYLSRGTKTLDNLVTLSGQSEKFCREFIDMLLLHNLITEEFHVPEPTPIKSQQQIESKKSFLSQLKSRLGIGK